MLQKKVMMMMMMSIEAAFNTHAHTHAPEIDWSILNENLHITPLRHYNIRDWIFRFLVS